MRAWWLIPVVAGGLSGCSGSDQNERAAAIDTTPDAPVLTAEGGVEVRSLLAADGPAVAVALGPHAGGALDMDPQARQAWETCGIRVVPFLVKNLATVERALTSKDKPAGRATRWLENGPLWAEAVREQGSAQTRVVALHDSRLQLRPGFLRLLARGWIEPALRESGGDARMGAVARVELVPQYVESGSEDRWARSLRLPTARGLEAQGQVLSRLAATLTLDPDEAVAIVFEEPGVDWGRVRERVAEPAAAPVVPGSAPPRLGQVTRAGEAPAAAAPEADSQMGAGPPVFHTQTLGEALLTGVGRGDAPGTRLVLILVPRMRDEFSLLGRDPPRPAAARP